MATNNNNEGLQGSPTSRSSLVHARNAKTVIDLAIHTQMEQLRRGTSSSPLVRRHKRFHGDDEDDYDDDMEGDDGLDGRGDSFLLVNVEDDDVDDDDNESASERGEGGDELLGVGGFSTPLRQQPGGMGMHQLQQQQLPPRSHQNQNQHQQRQQQQQSWRQQQQQRQQQPLRKMPVPQKLNRQWPPPQAQPQSRSQMQLQSQSQQRQLQRGDSGTGADSDLEVVLVDEDDDDDSCSSEEEGKEEPKRMGARPRAVPAPLPSASAGKALRASQGKTPPPRPREQEERGGKFDLEEQASVRPKTVMATATSPEEDEYASAAAAPVAKASAAPESNRRVSFNPMQMKREKDQCEEPKQQQSRQKRQQGQLLPRAATIPPSQRRQLQPRMRMPLDDDSLDAPGDEIGMIQSSLGIEDPNDMPADEYDAHVRSARLPRASVDRHPHHSHHRAAPQSRPEPEPEPEPMKTNASAQQVGGRYVHVDPVLVNSGGDAPAWGHQENADASNGASMSNAALADEDEEEEEDDEEQADEVDERGDIVRDEDEARIGLGIAPRGKGSTEVTQQQLQPQREEISQGDFSVSISVGAAGTTIVNPDEQELQQQRQNPNPPGGGTDNGVVAVQSQSSSETLRTDDVVADASAATTMVTKMTSSSPSPKTTGHTFPDKAQHWDESELGATFATMNTTLTTLETTQSSFNTTNQDISLNAIHDVSTTSSTYYQQQSSAPCTTVAGVVTPMNEACYTSFESQRVPPTSNMGDFHFFEGGGGAATTKMTEPESSPPPPPPPPADRDSTPTSIDYTTPQMRNTKTSTDRTPPSATSPSSSESLFSTLLEGMGVSSPKSSSSSKTATGEEAPSGEGENNGDGGTKGGGIPSVGEAATGVTDALASAIAWLDSPLVDPGGDSGEGAASAAAERGGSGNLEAGGGDSGRKKKNNGRQKNGVGGVEDEKPINTIEFSPKKKKSKNKSTSSSPSLSNSTVPAIAGESATTAATDAKNIFHPRLSVSAEDTNTAGGTSTPQTPQRSVSSSDNREQRKSSSSRSSSIAGRKNRGGGGGGGRGRSSSSAVSSTTVGGGGGSSVDGTKAAIEELADKENAEEAGCASFMPSGMLWDTVAYYMDPFNMLGINDDDPKPSKGRGRDAGRRRSKRRGGGRGGRHGHSHSNDDGYSEYSSSDDGSSCGSRSLDDRSWISDDDDRSYITDVTERTPVNEATPVRVAKPTSGLPEATANDKLDEKLHVVTDVPAAARDVESHAGAASVGATPDVHDRGNDRLGQPIATDNSMGNARIGSIHDDNVLAHAVPFLDDGGASGAANVANRGPSSAAVSSPGEESNGSETRDNVTPQENEPHGTAISMVEKERVGDNEKASNPRDHVEAEVNDEDVEHANMVNVSGLSKEEEIEYMQQVKLQLRHQADDQQTQEQEHEQHQMRKLQEQSDQHEQEHMEEQHMQQPREGTDQQPTQHHQHMQQLQHNKPSGQKPLKGILRLNRPQRTEPERADHKNLEQQTHGQPPAPPQVVQEPKKTLVGILRSHQPPRHVNEAAHGRNVETADADPRQDEEKAQIGASLPAQEPKVARPSQAELDEQFINDFISEGISLTWHSAHSTENYVPPPSVHLGMEMVNDGPSSMEPVFSWHVKGRPKTVHSPSSSGGIHNGYLRVFDVASIRRVGNMNLHSYPFVVPNNSFCMTDGDGSVVLFEARSERDQKRIVRGLRVLVSRLVSDIISGNDDAFFLRLDQEQLLPRSKAMDELAHLLVDESRSFAQRRKPMAPVAKRRFCHRDQAVPPRANRCIRRCQPKSAVKLKEVFTACQSKRK